jgi:mRNA-degrading endonuclease RelE of RelBE toxin-antitoxin system
VTTETIFSAAALRDLDRLDNQVAQRVLRAIQRLVDTGQGDVIQLQASGGERRLRVGDWRVRFLTRLESRPAPPPATGTVEARVFEIVRVLPRGRAYRD